MSLKYVTRFDNVAQIGDRNFNFRPWNTKDEKNYLIAVEAEEEIEDSKLFDILIRPCLEDDKVILTPNEQKMLMIEIRKKSIGQTFPMRFICSECKQVNDLDVELDKIVKFKPDNFTNEKIDNMVFNFGPIPTENLRKRLDDTDNNVDFAFVEFLLHIRSIEIDGKVENSFTFDELKSFIEDLPTLIFDDLYNRFQKMKSELVFEFSPYCFFCNSQNNIDFDYIPNFLWG